MTPCASAATTERPSPSPPCTLSSSVSQARNSDPVSCCSPSSTIPDNDADDAVSLLRRRIVGQIRRLQLVCFCVTLGVVLPAPSLPYYFTKHLAFSSSSYGLIVGASSLGHLAAAIVCGRASDYWGRRKVLILQTIAGFLLYAAFGAVIIFDDANLKLNSILLFILLGCSNTVNLLTCSAVCDLCLPIEIESPRRGELHLVNLAKERPKFLAQVAGVLGLAAAIGPVLGQTVQRSVATAPDSPVVVLFLAALANVVGGIVALSTTETNVQLPSYKQSVNRSKCHGLLQFAKWCSSSCLCGGIPEGAPATQICAKSENSFQKRAGCPLLELSAPATPERPKPEHIEPPVAQAHIVSPVALAVCTESSATRTSLGDQGSSCGLRTAEQSRTVSEHSAKIEVLLPADDRPDWGSLKSIYVCQLLKSLSLTSMTVCYALVLDLLLPPRWLFGLKSEQIIAIGLSTGSIVRVSIQLGYFQQLLLLLRGPGVAFLIGCVLMCVGQLASYWSIADLPRLMHLTEAVETNDTLLILVYAGLLFLVSGTILTAGISLVEPSLSALLALGVADHKSHQGLAQGFNSAINQLGATVGPPIMGWLLSMKSIASSYGQNCAPGTPVLPVNPQVEFGMRHGKPLLLETWNVNPNEELLAKVIPSLPVVDLWDITVDSMNNVGALSSDAPTLPSLVYQHTGSLEHDCIAQTARPLLPFVAGAMLAILPLALSKRILRLSRGWEK